MKNNKQKLVWVAQGYLDAQIKKTYLNSYGIEPILYEESLGTLYGLTSTSLGEVEIFVKTSDFEKALTLLHEIAVYEDDTE